MRMSSELRRAGLLRLLRSLFPLDCPLCGAPPWDGTPNMFCVECLAQMPFYSPPFCPKCGGTLDGIGAICSKCMLEQKRPWIRGYAVFRMDGLLRSVVHSYKYRGHPELIRAMGELAARVFLRDPVDVDFIVPTPLHWTRRIQRGFNQSELLAERISLATGIPVLHALKRTRATKRQARLKRNQRLRNLSGAFSLNDSTNVKKRAILLVDDVMTTGMTLEKETKVLLRAGASAVYVLVLARR